MGKPTFTDKFLKCGLYLATSLRAVLFKRVRRDRFTATPMYVCMSSKSVRYALPNITQRLFNLVDENQA
jgi:hypothetical protein